MIKMYAACGDGSGDICFLGLEPGNIDRLKQGDPIVIRSKDLGCKANFSLAVCFLKGKEFAAPHDKYKGGHPA